MKTVEFVRKILLNLRERLRQKFKKETVEFFQKIPLHSRERLNSKSKKKYNCSRTSAFKSQRVEYQTSHKLLHHC